MTNDNQNIQQAKGGQQNPYMIPVAILIAGLLISGAVIYNNKGGGSSSGVNTVPLPNIPEETPPSTSPPPSLGSGATDNIKPITNADHIKGNLDAPVKIVEFSDLECPFCKRFHPTLQQAVDEYDGQVAWVYRHFPLDQLHSKARKEAQATECANELGGNGGFWAYTDKLFEITPANNGLDLSLLPQIAGDIGLDRGKFEECLNSDKYEQHIEDDYQDAIASGGRGTPYSVVIAPNGKTFPLSGAQPYSAVKSIIELALKEK